MDKRVEAIRNDEVVGKWTCSVIDECYNDDDLITELDAKGITTAANAIRWARVRHDTYMDMFNDIAATAF